MQQLTCGVELVPDLWNIAEYCIDEITVLAKELKVKLAT